MTTRKVAFMLTAVLSGLVGAMVVLAGQKLSVSFRALLHLSEDLDPPRPVKPEFRMPGVASATLNHETTESMLRLSSAICGSATADRVDSRQSSLSAEVPVA
jgi:hypothetical protein